MRGISGKTTAALLAVILIIAACGHFNAKDSRARMAVQPQTVQAHISIEEEIAQLELLAAPAEVDSLVFNELKEALRVALQTESAQKAPCRPPNSPENAIPDLAMTSLGFGKFRLTWRYYNVGDYDQNGIVSVSDLTPLAIHYGEQVPPGDSNSLQAVIDGNGNGIVDVADVTQIAVNLGVRVNYFGIWRAKLEKLDEPFYHEYEQSANRDLGTGAATGRMSYAVEFYPVIGAYYWVTPEANSLYRGVASNIVQAGSPPIVSLTANVTSATVPFDVEFDASESADLDGSIVRYEWDPKGEDLYGYQTGTDPTFQFAYSAACLYISSVRVTDDDGIQSVARIEIRANDPNNLLPEARLEGSPLEGTVPFTVNLDAGTSTDGDGYIGLYEWDWDGDGVFEEHFAARKASHVYGEPGTYQAAVRVWDNLYSVDEASVTIQANSPIEWVRTWDTSAFVKSNNAVAACDDGCTVVTGRSDGNVITIKYSPEGELLWQQAWTGASYETPSSISLDTHSNILITGYTQSFGSDYWDVFLLKYSPEGVLMWQSLWGGARLDSGTDVAADIFGNIYVAGESTNNGDILLLKFNSLGSLRWARAWDSERRSGIAGMEADALGNIYIAGSEADPGRIAVIKYNADGELLWQRMWEAQSGCGASDIALSKDGDVYIGGYLQGEAGEPQRCLLLQLSEDGHLLMQSGLNWTGGFVSAIALDDDDNIIIGSYSGYSDRNGVYPVLSMITRNNTFAWSNILFVERDFYLTDHVFGFSNDLFVCGNSMHVPDSWQSIPVKLSFTVGTLTNASGVSIVPSGAARMANGNAYVPSVSQNSLRAQQYTAKIDPSNW